MKNSKFQFSNPNLTKLVFKANPDFEQSLYKGISLESKTHILKSKENSNAIVELIVLVGKEVREYPFFVEVAMNAEFMWEKELDEEVVDDLLKKNAPSLILSYIRPIIATVTNNSQYPVFNLPYIDMQDNVAIMEERE